MYEIYMRISTSSNKQSPTRANIKGVLGLPAPMRLIPSPRAAMAAKKVAIMSISKGCMAKNIIIGLEDAC